MGEQLWRVAQISARTVSLLVISPVFWLTLWVTYCYYKKYEWKEAGARRLALASSIEGLFAGFFVIWLTTFLGLTVKPGPELYWMGPAAMGLSMVRSRFLCLSYGAGIVFMIGQLLGKPVDIVGVCGLVGLLHLAEGLLVLCVGGKHTVPIYCSKRTGFEKGSGIYRFWPVPICLLIAVEEGGSLLTMPRWWPLLSTIQTIRSLGLLPLAVTLGYSDWAGKIEEVEIRRRLKGSLILIYAILLLGLSIGSSQEGSQIGSTVLRWVAALWMVVGHEAIVLYPKWAMKVSLKFVHKNRLETHTGCVYNRMK